MSVERRAGRTAVSTAVSGCRAGDERQLERELAVDSRRGNCGRSEIGPEAKRAMVRAGSAQVQAVKRLAELCQCRTALQAWSMSHDEVAG